MAPAASMIHSATAGAASNKRPAAASDAADELPTLDSSSAAASNKGHQQQQNQLECPRCRSTNTKFCYYNNYSAAQPRHFCRACRRYWTHGGTLRDVPVGGASRRSSSSNKRRRVDSAEPSSSSASLSPPMPPAASASPFAEADACLPLPDFPFLSDGSFFPQFDLGGGGGVALAPAAAFSSWQSSSVVPDFYDGLAPWDYDGATTAGTAAPGFAGAWGDIAGLDLSWTPPGN